MNTDKECSDANQDVEDEENKKSTRHINKLPRSAFALYIKLYCSQKDTKSLKHTNKMIEATKSWITLNDLEKQKFYRKYKEYKHKSSDLLVNCLQKSKPFMKRKGFSSSQKPDSNIYGHHKLEDKMDEPNLPHLQSEYVDKDNVMNGDKNDITVNCDEIEREEIANTYSIEQDTVKQSIISYPEPIAPNLLSGKELFEIVKSNAESNLTWATLSQRERNIYNQAILTIKKDYIHKYKLYLENLTDNNLFDHYIKCFH